MRSISNLFNTRVRPSLHQHNLEFWTKYFNSRDSSLARCTWPLHDQILGSLCRHRHGDYNPTQTKGSNCRAHDRIPERVPSRGGACGWMKSRVPGVGLRLRRVKLMGVVTQIYQVRCSAISCCKCWRRGSDDVNLNNPWEDVAQLSG